MELRNNPEWRAGYNAYEQGMPVDGGWSANRVIGWLAARNDELKIDDDTAAL